MHIKTISFLVFLISVAAEDDQQKPIPLDRLWSVLEVSQFSEETDSDQYKECEDLGRKCIVYFVSAVTENDYDYDPDGPCNGVREMVYCLWDVVETCIAKDKRDEAGEMLWTIYDKVEEMCPLDMEGLKLAAVDSPLLHKPMVVLYPSIIAKHSSAEEFTYSDYDENGENDDEEMVQCYSENENYIMACKNVTMHNAAADMGSSGGLDSLLCRLYSKMADCFIERVGEMCGDKASAMAKQELRDLPQTVKDSCKKMKSSLDSNGLDVASFQLLDKKRK